MRRRNTKADSHSSAQFRSFDGFSRRVRRAKGMWFARSRRLSVEPLEGRLLLASDAFLAAGLIERLDFEEGTIARLGEIDEIAVVLDAGQTLSLLAETSPDLALTLAVRNPQGQQIGVTAGDLGETLALNTMRVVTSGVYTIVVGSVEGTVGAYDVTAAINATWEPEQAGGGSNDAASFADDLDGSAISIGGIGVDRLAVLGKLSFQGDVDYYRFTLADRQTASFSLQGAPGGDAIKMELLGPTGAPVALSVAAEDGVQTISGLSDLTSDGGPSEYVARISANAHAPLQDYALVIGRGIDLEREPNNSVLKAQSATEALGRLGKSVHPGASLANEFRGMDYFDTTCGCEPPDTHLAVGPDHVVEVVNTAIAFYNKDGSLALPPVELDQFFRPSIVAGDNFLFDPVVAYDELANRFIVAILSAGSSGTAESDLLYAVSDTSDPAAGFTEQHRIDFSSVSPGLFADYPKIGFNADAHVLTFNMFGQGFEKVDVLVIDKSSVLDKNDATLGSRILPRTGESFTLAPATMHGSLSGGPMWFVEEVDYGGTQDRLRVVKLDDVLAAAPQFTHFAVRVPSYEGGGLPGADQPGGSKFNTNDARILNSEFRDGRLVATHSASNGEIAQVRWYEFDVASGDPTLTQSGVINPGPGVATYFPSIALGPEGHIGLNYMQSSLDEYVSMYVAGQPRDSLLGVMSAGILVKRGNQVYSGGRGGDYSGIGVDPIDGTFWAANEVSLSGAPDPLWSTWIAQFSVAPLEDEDWYAFTAEAGANLSLTTFTPLDGPFLVNNALDPIVELYGPTGELLASDDNSSADGRNAALTAIAEAGGVYRVKVYAASEVAGVYRLLVLGGANQSERTRVVAMEPADRAVVRQAPSVIRLHFSEGVHVASIRAEDVLIGGLAARRVAFVDGRTVDFFIDPLAISGDGTYDVIFAQGAITDLRGQEVDGFTGSFRVDATGPRLIETRWNGAPLGPGRKISPGPLTFSATFDEDLLTISSARRGLRTPGADDLFLREAITGRFYRPPAVAYDRSTFTFTATFGPLPEGNYSLVLVSGDLAFEDSVGNDLDGEPGPNGDGAPTGNGSPGGDYRINFSVDIASTPAQFNPFVREEPLGSQIFASRATRGTINVGGDLDVFRLQSIVGERTSLRITPLDSRVQLTAAYRGVSYDAASPGAEILIESPVSLDATEQFLTLSGDRAAEYRIDVFLNADIGGLTVGEGGPLALTPSQTAIASESLFGAVAAARGVADSYRVESRVESAAFVDISTSGTRLALDDDESRTIITTIGNSLFPAGPTTIGNNGGIIAGAGGSLSPGNGPLPSADFRQALLPFWSDVDGTSGAVYWEERLVGDVPTLIVQWHNRPQYPNIGRGTFQLQLFATGPIAARFAYRDVLFGDAFLDRGASATIGVQISERNAVEFSFLEPSVSNGTVLDFLLAPGIPDVDEFKFAVNLSQTTQTIDAMIVADDSFVHIDQMELIDPEGRVLASSTLTQDAPLSTGTIQLDQVLLGIEPTVAGEYTLRVTTKSIGEYTLALGVGTLLDGGGDRRLLTPGSVATGYLDDSQLPRLSLRRDPDAFIDISSTGAPLGLSDDGEATIVTTVGNSLFPAGPTTVANNGGILAGAGYSLGPGNRMLPDIRFREALIPFWDDIDSATGDVYWEERTIDGHRGLIVQWESRPHFSFGGSATFQVQVLASGPLLARFAYRDVDFGAPQADRAASATIGVQLNPTTAVQFSFNNPVVASGDVIEVTQDNRDFYQLDLVEGQVARLELDTPFDDPRHQPLNASLPRLVITTPAGALLADLNANGLGVRQQSATFVAGETGVYRVALSSATSGGEYALAHSLDDAEDWQGDYVDDQRVDGLDFLLWQRDFGSTTRLDGDANDNGRIDNVDLQIFEQRLGEHRGDFPDVIGQAPFLAVPGDIRGVVGGSGDVDAFALQALAGLRHRLRVTPLNVTDNLTVTVFGLDGRVVVAADLDGGAGLVEWTPTETGIYYLHVQSPDASEIRYHLRTERDDHGDAAQTATALALPLSADGNLDSAQDVDWFSFVARAGIDYRIETILIHLNDSAITLYDQNGRTKIASNDDFNGTLASQLLWTPDVEGVYFVEVRGFGGAVGTYQLDVVPLDDHGSSGVTATPIPVPFVVNATIGSLSDVDWFSFRAIAGHSYRFVGASQDMDSFELALIGRDAESVLAYELATNASALTVSWIAPQSGVYYLVFTGGFQNLGGYRLDVLSTSAVTGIAPVEGEKTIATGKPRGPRGARPAPRDPFASTDLGVEARNEAFARFDP